MKPPPPHIDGARVLKAADLSGTTATGTTIHYRDGELQVGFAHLALAQYDGDEATYIFYCDAGWNCLNDTCHADLADAEAQAIAEFRGLTFVEVASQNT